MVLRGELLGAQLERGDHLLRQRPRVLEPEGHHRNLSDEGVVRDHHRARAEERLEVIGELGPPGVAGVHGDEHATPVVEVELGVLEDEPLLLLLDGDLNRENLLRDDGEHLEVDAVELVEARPRAAGRQAFEELGHREVIEAVGAVENHALHRERLGEIFGGLRLARTRGSRGGAAEVKMHRAHQRHVAPVRQRRDHEPRLIAEVFVTERKRRLDHLHVELTFVLTLVLLLTPILPVVTQLRDPIEIAELGHLLVP